MNQFETINRPRVLWPALALGLGMMLANATVSAKSLNCEATSPKNRMALVELYTSEGCSSCPPADKWLSQVQTSDRVIPIALHVDYWDYIGWKDRFADPRFTKRQREISFRNRLDVIYTPQVVVDGKDFPSWWNARQFLDSVERISSTTAPVSVVVEAQLPAAGTGATVSVKVTPVEAGGESSLAGSQLHVAVVEDELSTDVERGENAGVTLRHDKVVRHWLRPVSLRNGQGQLSREMKLPADIRQDKLGIVAFAQGSDGQVIQAVACQFKAGS